MKDNRCDFFFLFFKAEFFNIWFFVEENVLKGFIDDCVCDTYDSYGGLRKISKHFTFSIICVLPLPPQNEILSRFFCYLKLVCLFGFGVEESFATEFNESESWTSRLFTADYPKSFWPHLLAFRSCIRGEPVQFLPSLIQGGGGGGSTSAADVLLLCSMKLDLLFSLFVLKSVKYNFLKLFCCCCCFHNGNHR